MKKRNIAIFRALYLGDMLCIIPTVRAIRANWPDAKITLIGLPWQQSFAARFSQYFDEFIPFPGWPGLPEQDVDPQRCVSFLQEMQRKNFEIVFQMQGNGMITNTMCMLWGARQICGLRTPGGWSPDDQYFPESPDTDHEVLRFFKLLECFRLTPRSADLEFPISEAEELTIRKKLDILQLSPGHYVCLHPGARDTKRRWPKQNFAQLAREIQQRGYPVVLTGSEDERVLLGDLEKSLEPPVINIVDRFGHLPLGELAALLRQSKLLVSNDTGVSHIAAALSVPSVIIFSPWSDINRWRPTDAQRHLAIPHEYTENIPYITRSVVALLDSLEESLPFRTPG